MTLNTVTTANWNSPTFWGGISEAGTGHTLDLSGLGSGFFVDLNRNFASPSISDEPTTFTVDDAMDTTADTNGFGPINAQFAGYFDQSLNAQVIPLGRSNQNNKAGSQKSVIGYASCL